MKKIRVLHIVQSMETGGLENGIVNLVNNSNSDEFVVDILCLREKGELAERVTNPNSHIFFDGNTQHSKLIAIKKVYLHCKQHQYDIIHSHGYATMLAAYVGGTFARCPNIINGEHGTLYYSSKKEVLIQRYLFNRMKLNLSVSRVLQDKVCETYSLSQKIFKTIINGVDTQKFNPGFESQSLRKQLDVQESKVIIGSVGRLVAVKNYPSLIRAMSLIVEKFPNVKLLLAGDGPERKKLENLITELELTAYVTLLGRREDVPELMNLYDIFVLPSFSEGLSNTLLESMACGTPVVASDVGGNKEIVAEGITGHLYPSDDSNELAKLLSRLVEEEQLREKLGAQARKHIEDNFSIASMVNNYENTYQDLLRSEVRH